MNFDSVELFLSFLKSRRYLALLFIETCSLVLQQLALGEQFC